MWTSDFIFNATGFQLEFIPYLIRGRNDEKKPYLKFVSVAPIFIGINSSRRPVQEDSMFIEWATPPANDVYAIMDSLVREKGFVR